MNRRLKVAVADDDPDTLAYLVAYLSRLGHQVAAAADGRLLVGVCRAFAPDVVVTDCQMPGLDGVAAAAEVNGRGRVPVVLISGRVDLDQLGECGDGHIVARLRKPVREADLAAAVEAAGAAAG